METSFETTHRTGINWPGAAGTGMRSLHSDRDRSALNKELRIAMKRVNGQLVEMRREITTAITRLRAELVSRWRAYCR